MLKNNLLSAVAVVGLALPGTYVFAQTTTTYPPESDTTAPEGDAPDAVVEAPADTAPAEEAAPQATADEAAPAQETAPAENAPEATSGETAPAQETAPVETAPAENDGASDDGGAEVLAPEGGAETTTDGQPIVTPADDAAAAEEPADGARADGEQADDGIPQEEEGTAVDGVAVDRVEEEDAPVNEADAQPVTPAADEGAVGDVTAADVGPENEMAAAEGEAPDEEEHEVGVEEEGHAGDSHATPHIENIDFSFDGPFGTYDVNQLQRGLQIYTEVCSACHGLKYVALRTLADEGGPSLPEEQVIEYSKQWSVFDPELDDMRDATPVDHFPESNLANAPDLSLMAKKRAAFHGPYGLGINQFFKGIGGAEYITAILTSYTGETREQAGAVFYENTAFPGGWIAMSPPLSDDLVEFADGHDADLHHLAEDVSAFLMWTAEPKLGARKTAGFAGVLFLTLLSVLLYLTNKRLWAPVKHRKPD